MKQHINIATIIASIILTATPVRADYQAGMSAYRVHHYKWAIKEFKTDQTRESEYMLGVIYYNGEGVKVDQVEGTAWFRKSADQGHAQAQYVLGNIYFEGKGVALDRTEAAKWYRKAAEQGHLQAQYNLGLIYMSGDGVEKNRNKAVIWLKKATLSGSRDAGRLLKIMGEEIPAPIQPNGAKSPKKPLTEGAPSVLPPGHLQ